jgi:hypothetical protein
MIIHGEVKKKEFLRGGVGVIIDPVTDGQGDKAYKGRPRSVIELIGLSDEAGKEFQEGQVVAISIGVVEGGEPEVEVEPKGAAVDLTGGEEDLGPSDEALGD